MTVSLGSRAKTFYSTHQWSEGPGVAEPVAAPRRSRDVLEVAVGNG